MPVPSSPHPTAILLVHDDGELLDALTRTFEGQGLEVAIAATEFAAINHLQSPRPIGAVVAGWHAGGGIGAAVYRWALAHRYDLRARFVFVAPAPPRSFDDLVQGRCLLVKPDEHDEIVRIAAALAERSGEAPGANAGARAVDWGPGGKPSLLLIEDDPLQLAWMTSLLAEMGFEISSVESSRAAMAQLASTDFEVILSDWYMADGSGADLHRWLTKHRPHLASRCVFMSASLPGQGFARLASGRPVIPKGQDADTLLGHLRAIVQEAREQGAGEES